MVFYRISSKFESMTIAMMVKTAVGHSTDLIKDILLAVQISLSQGGIVELMMQDQQYIRAVSPFLLLVGVECRIENQNIRKSPFKKAQKFLKLEQKFYQYNSMF